MSSPLPVISPAWLPANETALDIYNERTLLDGAIMTGVVYGIHFTIFVQTAYLLMKDLHRKSSSQFFLAYIIVMFILGTLFVSSSSRVAQMTFVDDRNYPGGPEAWQEAAFSIPANLLGNITFTLANWLADALMIWRCYIIWTARTGRYVWLILAIPCLLWLASFAMGTLLLTQVSQPGLSIWSDSSVNFALAYFSISLTLNILTTVLILARLMYHRLEVTRSLGHAYGTYYTSVAAMLVESASLYAACSLLFLVPYVLNHPLQNIFMQVLSQVQIIAPLLVIFRVASGHGITSTALSTGANLSFATNPTRPSDRTRSTRAHQSNYSTELSHVSRPDLIVHFKDTYSDGHSESMLTPVSQDKVGAIAEKVVEVKAEP
ncbi:hypothetical protein OE88DRAFT_1642333 [Heliocybe sulcata]|uniref:G-protein coupled receptors family 1 profile domain-containing protein n=1 Tax=Heliocybe sulcata TaxID=5364 RepID=A0A5C3NB99_9AGAM|nr:hypothetical protein OE88DRAFT_1642333 [Heliocybe sulcata]